MIVIVVVYGLLIVCMLVINWIYFIDYGYLSDWIISISEVAE